MKKDLVVKDNALINASYNLDLVEQRLILLAIVEARQSNTGITADKPLSVHAASYINHFGVVKHTAYEALKVACKGLFNRQFSYQEQRGGGIAQVTTRWVSQIAYIENTATVEMIFSPAVVPLVTELEKHFTSYELEQVSGLSSAYAVRLYEILIAWRSTGKVPMIELEEFRNRLGVGVNEYQRMGQFKEKVLHFAINQINEHTDITASYEQHKRGRVIIGFSFQFKQKPQEQPTDTSTKGKDTFCNLSDSQIKMYSSILSQLHSLSDLSTFPNYKGFEVWIANILRDPASVREETVKRIFKALRTETDFKDGKN
jgi:plasmid replication initiation protein